MDSTVGVITARAPGKLYVAGEYAVVEAGHAAVLIAVDRFLTVRARPSEALGHIHSSRFAQSPIIWQHVGDELKVLEGNPEAAGFILSAISYVERLVLEEGNKLTCFDLEISSDLDDSSGRKFGLGSSAAVTVATVKALAKLYQLNLDEMRIYQLAFLAAHAIQPSGSGGDIATATFAGCITYSSPDRVWLVEAQREISPSETPIHTLLERTWPGLSIERLTMPKDINVMIGWTGAPASTPELVGKVQSTVKSGAQHDSPAYQEFLHRSDACVEHLKESMARFSVSEIGQSIREARQALAYLSSITGTIIETPRLRRLVEIAQEFGAAAKSSGAGGGDCGIAVCGPDAEPEQIRKAWAVEGIQALDMTVYNPQLDDESDDGTAIVNNVSQRKNDHIRLADKQQSIKRSNAFDDLRVIHHAFPDMAMRDVDLSTSVCGSSWSSPFYINAMTGGSSRSNEINTALALAAAQTGLAIASGSQHAALRDSALTASFTTIRQHTAGFVFANVGPTVDPNQAVAAVSMLDADALQIHVNAAQEMVMPEGDRDFTSWRKRISDIIEAVQVPVIVKEVGFGLSSQSIGIIQSLGARAVDVSGQGGTDFVSIENSRRKRSEYAYLQGFGQSTALCLLDAQQHGYGSKSSLEVLASGGIRNPFDVLKALVLGARAVGVSGHFLHTYLQSGSRALVEEIQSWQGQLRSLMTLVGAQTIEDLQRCDILVTGTSKEEAELLGIDCGQFARRSYEA